MHLIKINRKLNILYARRASKGGKNNRSWENFMGRQNDEISIELFCNCLNYFIRWNER